MAVVTVYYLTDNGATVSALRQPGNSPGSVGGFDVQKDGENSYLAADGKIMRATTLGGDYLDYYTITGSVQAACIIVPYFTWAGASQMAATHPDIIAGFTGPDGSSRRLVWIEGGATPGTVHDITPDSGITFDNPNAITSHFHHHIAVVGLIGGVYKLLTTNNQGSSWTNRGTVSGFGFIRCRREDNSGSASGTNLGQLYLADSGLANKILFSSKWAGGGGPNIGMYIRNVPFTPTGLDTVF